MASPDITNSASAFDRRVRGLELELDLPLRLDGLLRAAAAQAGSHRDDAEHSDDQRYHERRLEPVEQRLRRSRRARVGVDDGRHDGQCERPAELEGRVQESAGETLLARRDAVRGRDVERPEGECEAEPGEQERRQHRERVARVQADRQEQRIADDDRDHAGDDQPRDAEAHDERRDARRDDRDEHARREDREAGLERRPTAQLLHVERCDELESDPAAEQRHRAQVGAHERPRAQDAEAHERRGGALLAGDERRQQDRRACERQERAAGGPAGVRRVDQRVHEQQHRARDRHRAGDVERAPAARRPAAVGHEAESCDQRDQRHRGGQQEDPAPSGLRQQAADHEPEREARGSRRGVDGERLVARPSLRERGRDDRQAGRRGERRGHALDEAGRDEQRPVVHERTEHRRNREHAKGNQKHLPPTKKVCGAPAEQQEPAVAEHVRAHDPLQRARREAEVALDRRQCDADHRDVEGVQEEGAAEHEQRAPGAPAEPSGTVIEFVRGLWDRRGHTTPCAW